MTDDPVATAVRAYRRAEAALDKRRGELADAIGHAVLVDNRKQADVARLTGYTREHIRRICRDYADREIGRTRMPETESAHPDEPVF
ncbi:hypothetical protein ABGB07_02175 [Micromonosporaceae bacterium B7E4]